MAIPQLQPWSRLIPTFIISCLINVVVVMVMLVRMVIIGPKQYFCGKNRRIRPPVLDSPDLGTHGYARLSEVTLHYVSKGDSKAPLMLFLHGFPDFFFSWRHQIKEFGKSYRAVAVDLRGYGDSSKPTSVSDYCISRLTKDIQELVHHLGYEKCVLVGHDWGASVAWNVNFQYPELIDKLIILNLPHTSAFQKHLRTHWSQMKKSWYMFFFQLPFIAEIMTGANDLTMLDQMFTNPKSGAKSGAVTAEEVEAYKYTFQNYSDRRGPINFYRAAMRYMPSRVNVHISGPVLLIWGVKDKFLEMAAGEKSKEYCKNFKFVPIESAGHFVQVDSPQEVNQHMWDFLQS